MEEKHQPVHPKETQDITPKPNHKTVSLPIVIVLIAATAILVGTTVFFILKNSNTPLPAPESSTMPKVSTLPITTQWKTYTNYEAGFTLKYPDTVLYETNIEKPSKPVLYISTEKLSNIPEELPSLMGRNDALKEKAMLEKGEGETLVKIGSLYGNLDMVLSRFEICSVILTRTLTFYPGEYRVILSLVGPEKEIMDSMPDFFTIDQANCGENLIWNRDKSPTFSETLAQKKGQGASQEWYDTFDAIVKTINVTTTASSSITPSPSAVTSDWSVYKNEKYGFEISYPKTFKALSSKDDLYGYPNGVLLLYKGGQAYDVVIEVWDTEAAYKENYASMMSDITVVKSNGKFITLLNSTKEPDNAKIIASFKLGTN